MSVNFIFVLLLGKHVNCYLDISSDSAKTVISHDSPQNDEGCNLDPFLTKDNAIPGGQIEAEAIGVTKDGGKSDAAAKKFGSSSSAGSGGAVVEAKDDLPCSAPLTGYQQDDPILVSLVRRCHIDMGPTTSSASYNFSASQPNTRGQVDQPVLVDLIYNKSLEGGFFIEAGAWDGESLSNSLLFELDHGWSGLLVEPNPTAFQKLQLKHRKAYTSPACLSPHPRSSLARLTDQGMLGVLTDEVEGQQVLCLPLYTLLLALGNPTVHYLSLDIEGGEMGVLRSLPWHKVDIWLLSVETNHGSGIPPPNQWSRQELVNFMENQGYQWIGTAGIDDLFCRPDKVSVPESLVVYIRQQRLPNFFSSSDREALMRDNTRGRLARSVLKM